MQPRSSTVTVQRTAVVFPTLLANLALFTVFFYWEIIKGLSGAKLIFALEGSTMENVDLEISVHFGTLQRDEHSYSAEICQKR